MVTRRIPRKKHHWYHPAICKKNCDRKCQWMSTRKTTCIFYHYPCLRAAAAAAAAGFGVVWWGSEGKEGRKDGGERGIEGWQLGGWWCWRSSLHVVFHHILPGRGRKGKLRTIMNKKEDIKQRRHIVIQRSILVEYVCYIYLEIYLSAPLSHAKWVNKENRTCSLHQHLK